MAATAVSEPNRTTHQLRRPPRSRPFRDCLQRVLEEGVSEAPPKGRWHKSVHKALAKIKGRVGQAIVDDGWFDKDEAAENTGKGGDA